VESRFVELGEEYVYDQMEQAVSALRRLVTLCALPSPWEAINMLKCAPTCLVNTGRWFRNRAVHHVIFIVASVHPLLASLESMLLSTKLSNLLPA
jgi:hypothetical protein